MTYTVQNSTDGITSFLSGLTDFAVTGPYAQSPASSSQTFKFAPLTTSALVLGYRIYDLNGPQITSLTLTPDLIARIFLGQVPNWAANTDITTLNPGVNFPPREVPFVRAEHSAQSLVFTSWLKANSPAWTAANAGCPGTASSSGGCDIFPIPTTQVQGRTGSDAVGLAVADPTTDFFGQGNIGFMDSSTAAFYGLPTVRIKRADGSMVTATPAAITQAIADATASADGTLALNYGDTNPQAYPMPEPTYMLAPTNTIDPARGATIAAFLRYAVQDGQSALPAGYAPLPSNLVSESMQAAAAIPVAPASTPTPSPSPGASGTSSSTTSSTSSSASAAASLAQIPGLPPQLQQPLSHLEQLVFPNRFVNTTRSGVGTQHVTTPSSGRATPTPTPRRRAVLELTQIGDWSGFHLLLPFVITVGVLGLGSGVAIEVVTRRRRAGANGVAD